MDNQEAKYTIDQLIESNSYSPDHANDIRAMFPYDLSSKKCWSKFKTLSTPKQEKDSDGSWDMIAKIALLNRGTEENR